jgi:hypothetical protein
LHYPGASTRLINWNFDCEGYARLATLEELQRADDQKIDIVPARHHIVHSAYTRTPLVFTKLSSTHISSSEVRKWRN